MWANATTRPSHANHQVVEPNIGDKSKPRQNSFGCWVEGICALQ
jgi:hypothetical protein